MAVGQVVEGGRFGELTHRLDLPNGHEIENRGWDSKDNDEASETGWENEYVYERREGS